MVGNGDRLAGIGDRLLFFYLVKQTNTQKMFSFFKKDDNSDVPAWASFFNDKEYLIFIKEIGKYFDKLSLSYKISDGFIQLDQNFIGVNQLGLLNVAQVCKQNEIKEYEEIIWEHFDALIRSNKFNNYFETIKSDFDMVKTYLGVRLYNDDYYEQVGLENTIGTSLTDTIYSTLVFDLPDSINNVKPEEAEKWGVDSNELINLGIKNTQQKYEWEITEEKIGNFNIWFVQSEHFFAPNIIFDLANRKDLLSDKGILIAMPHRHVVIIYPIKTLEVVEAINILIPMVYGMNQEGPGSLTNQLYFYKNEEFTNLPYEIIDDKLQFYPPEKFVEVLNSLK